MLSFFKNAEKTIEIGKYTSKSWQTDCFQMQQAHIFCTSVRQKQEGIDVFLHKTSHYNHQTMHVLSVTCR